MNRIIYRLLICFITSVIMGSAYSATAKNKLKELIPLFADYGLCAEDIAESPTHEFSNFIFASGYDSMPIELKVKAEDYKYVHYNPMYLNCRISSTPGRYNVNLYWQVTISRGDISHLLTICHPTSISAEEYEEWGFGN